MLNAIRYPEEKFLYDKLYKWSSAETIITLISSASRDRQHTSPLPRRYQITPSLTEYYRIVNEVAAALGMDRGTVAFYISESEKVGAWTIPRLGEDGFKAEVILSNGLIDILEADELKAVLAHELAHIAFNHHQLNLCIEWLDIKSKKGRLFALANIYYYWRKLAELSADRAAVLVVENHQSVISSLARRHLKSLASGLCFDAFIAEQEKKIVSLSLNEYQNEQYPPWEFRALVYHYFCRSDLARRLQKGCLGVDDSLEEVASYVSFLKVSPANESQFLEFAFLMMAGNYIIRSDGNIHLAEINRLRDIMSTLLHDPGCEMLMLDDLEQCCDMVGDLGAKIARKYPEKKEEIFELLCTLIVQDGKIDPAEKKAMDEIGIALHLPPENTARIFLDVLQHEFHPIVPDC